MTELLPTPPLPDATASTRAVAGTAVSGACSRACQRALSITSVRSSAFISPQSILTLRTPGWWATRDSTSFLIWARSGQPAIVSFTVMRTSPSGPMSTLGHHAEVDDVAAQLRVDDAPEEPVASRRPSAGHSRACILPVGAV